MSKLTLPIVAGKKYVRRDGKVITAELPDVSSEVDTTGSIFSVGNGDSEKMSRFGNVTDEEYNELLKMWDSPESSVNTDSIYEIVQAAKSDAKWVFEEHYHNELIHDVVEFMGSQIIVEIEKKYGRD